MAKLGTVFGQNAILATEGIPAGIFTLGINFDVNYSNINGQVNVVLPTITSENSFNMVELFNSFNEPLPQELPESELQPVIVTHTVTGGQLPKTSTHLYEVLLMGTVLTLIGAFTWKRKKRYE